MSTSQDHILREQRPVDSLIPALDGPLQLSERQIRFLLHAIQDIDPEAVNAKAEIRTRVLEVQSKCIVQFMQYISAQIAHFLLLRAYQIYPYPCIRTSHHVALFMSENDAFARILEAGQSARRHNVPMLLDIGCCMGTDLRHLVQSGYPSTSVIGCDVRRDFIDLGHMLYADRETCSIPFFVGDVFDIKPRPFPQTADDVRLSLKDVRNLDELRGRVKYIYAGALFHLFDEGTQEAIARRLVTLLDVTEENGPAVLFGRQTAREEEGVIDDAMGRTRYAHSPVSWKKLWERVLGDKIPVRVDARLHLRFASGLKGWAWNPGRGTEMMWWSVWVG